MKIRIVNVVGARPNFLRMAPLMTECARHQDRVDPVLVHTGQHCDNNMSKLFFEQWGLPKPDVHLGIGSGSHAQQTARTTQCLLEHPPTT
jgi:UDP-N-acetylglucosamine 2-epimerase (non-hydrolysing)